MYQYSKSALHTCLLRLWLTGSEFTPQQIRQFRQSVPQREGSVYSGRWKPDFYCFVLKVLQQTVLWIYNTRDQQAPSTRYMIGSCSDGVFSPNILAEILIRLTGSPYLKIIAFTLIFCKLTRSEILQLSVRFLYKYTRPSEKRLQIIYIFLQDSNLTYVWFWLIHLINYHIHALISKILF